MGQDADLTSGYVDPHEVGNNSPNHGEWNPNFRILDSMAMGLSSDSQAAANMELEAQG